MLRRRFDAHNRDDVADEWKAAAWLANEFNNSIDEPIYLRGSMPDHKDGTTADQVVRLYQSKLLTYDRMSSVRGLFWSADNMRICHDFTPPFGNPLYELLVGTFKAAETTAKLICSARGDWIYQLNVPRNRRLWVCADPKLRYSHQFAMRKIYGLP